MAGIKTVGSHKQRERMKMEPNVFLVEQCQFSSPPLGPRHRRFLWIYNDFVQDLYHMDPHPATHLLSVASSVSWARPGCLRGGGRVTDDWSPVDQREETTIHTDGSPIYSCQLAKCEENPVRTHRPHRQQNPHWRGKEHVKQLETFLVWGIRRWRTLMDWWRCL